MGLSALFFIALGLSMDAFAVAVSKGLAMRSFRWHQALSLSLCFGVLQGTMPILGYFIGCQFNEAIQDWDHWVAFMLLTLIGGLMIREGIKAEESPEVAGSLFTLGIATSIDALAIGVSFAFLNVNILSAALIIGITTFLFSLLGVKSGHFLGQKFKHKAEICGGVILILIALKVLYEHGIF